MRRAGAALALVALVALTLTAACGGRQEVSTIAPPGAPRAMPARYPAEAYIVGRGESSAGPAVAESEARRAVAEQIAASLTTELAVDERAAGGRESLSVDSRVRLRAFFDRAELIRLDPAETRCVDGRCRALAVLERAAAKAALADDYEAARDPLRPACALAEGDPLGLVRTRRHAERVFADLSARARVLESVARAPFGPFAEDRTCVDTLRARLRALAERLTVSVSAAAVADETLRIPVASALVGALQEMGLRAQPGEACTDGLALTARGDSTCAVGPLGPQCALALQVELRACADGALVTAVNLGDAGLLGVHPRDEAEAKANLRSRITAARLLPALRVGLSDVLPVRE